MVVTIQIEHIKDRLCFKLITDGHSFYIGGAVRNTDGIIKDLELLREPDLKFSCENIYWARKFIHEDLNQFFTKSPHFKGVITQDCECGLNNKCKRCFGLGSFNIYVTEININKHLNEKPVETNKGLESMVPKEDVERLKKKFRAMYPIKPKIALECIIKNTDCIYKLMSMMIDYDNKGETEKANKVNKKLLDIHKLDQVF